MAILHILKVVFVFNLYLLLLCICMFHVHMSRADLHVTLAKECYTIERKSKQVMASNPEFDHTRFSTI